jgi:hypothetical protein
MSMENRCLYDNVDDRQQENDSVSGMKVISVVVVRHDVDNQMAPAAHESLLWKHGDAPLLEADDIVAVQRVDERNAAVVFQILMNVAQHLPL